MKKPIHFLDNYLNPQRKHQLNDYLELSKLSEEYLPEWFTPMLADESRNSFYRSMIKDSARDKIIIDLGAGTGMWTIEALAQGAKFVYIVERNPMLIKYLEFIFADFPVKILPGDFEKLCLSDFDHGTPEVIIHEIFSNTGLGEGLISAFQKVSELFPNNSIKLLPQHIKIEARIVRGPPLKLTESEESHLKDKTEVYYEFVHSLGVRTWINTIGVNFESKEAFEVLGIDLHQVRNETGFHLKRIPIDVIPGLVHQVYLSFKFSHQADGPYFNTAFVENHWGGLLVEFYASKSLPAGKKFLKLELEKNLLFKNPTLVDQ